jgi:carbonic anhydrase
MERILLLACFALLILTNPSNAQDEHASTGENDSPATVASFLNSLKSDNLKYYMAHKIEFFSELAKGQHPTATIVTCSDSRVQTNMIDDAPEGQLFMIRNIGNQLTTAEGSVEYGVHHLHTPVLLFIGHSRCGAIAAATGNYAKESPFIKRELDTITISKDLNNIDGVRANIHNQVASAMLKFDDEVKEGKLTVIGAIMDFADDLHQGTGKLSFINVNGETDANKLNNIEAVLKAKRAKLQKK